MAMRLRGGSGDRKYCIAGNWKMNPSSLEEAKKLASDVRIDCCPCCVVVCGRVWSWPLLSKIPFFLHLQGVSGVRR